MPDFEYDYRSYLENIENYNENIITELQKIQENQQTLISGDNIKIEIQQQMIGYQIIICFGIFLLIIYHFMERMLKC